MNILYQIISKNTRAYTSNVAACDELCARIINNGGEVKVRRIKRSMVPTCDLELVNELK